MTTDEEQKRYNQLVAQSLRRLRRARRASQEEAAEAAGVAQGTWSRVEYGQVSPRVQWLDDLAEAWGFSLIHFVSEISRAFKMGTGHVELENFAPSKTRSPETPEEPEDDPELEVPSKTLAETSDVLRSRLAGLLHEIMQEVCSAGTMERLVTQEEDRGPGPAEAPDNPHLRRYAQELADRLLDAWKLTTKPPQETSSLEDRRDAP